MASDHISLDAATTERKARLAKLASLKRKQAPTEELSTDSSDATSTLNGAPPATASDTITSHLSLRNYDPVTRGPKLGFEAPPILPDQETLETRAASLAKETKAAEEKAEKEQAEGKGIDLFDLQPRKPNWDLKRDLARKMEILNQRTDNAIARMVRERIEGQRKKEIESKANRPGINGNGEGQDETVGIGGVDLVEGVHVRERAEEEEERRDKQVEAELEDV